MHLIKTLLKTLLFVPVLAVLIMAGSYEVADAKGGGGDGHGGGLHWEYTGENGHTHWGDLSADFKACGEGKSQSPINITKEKSAELTDISFDYHLSKLHILNNGHTIQANYDVGSSITVNGKRFNLLQLHFHGPSEHEVDGKLYNMEMHLVHKSKDGALAVVGVLIGEGTENSAFSGLWAHLPGHAGDKEMVNITIDAGELIPSDRAYTTYSGSLTTPPCSEGVTWLVLQNPIEMSAAQISAFGHIVSANNRPVQPLHGRDLTADTN